VAAMLSELVGERGEVWGIDTVDQRRCTEGFRFSLVTDPSLPFKDGYFDLVISNHVVEHVGERQDQLRHLREIARVLNRSGIGYIATPNRWTIIEPHYKLPFLSWPPPSLRTPYLKAIRRSSPYDCNPLSSSRISDLFRQAGLDHEDVTLEALRVSADVESNRIARLIMGAPRGLVHIVRPVIPTMIYLVKKG
jgi:SAM-dependent methyltransferase